MDALISSLIVWITASTGLTVPEAPRIVFTPDRQFQQLFHSDRSQDGNPEPTTSSRAPSSAEPFFRVQAFYLRATATIYLPETWRLEALRDRSTLLHELVHHAQRLNKVTVHCPAQLERQAYDLQAAWLREQGVEKPFDIIGVDEFTMMMMTACLPPDG